MMKTNKSYSLTKAQKRVWFNLKLSEKPLPNIAMVFELIGSLDVWALRKALENVVEENTVLKSTIYSSADHLERVVNHSIRGSLEFVDLTQEEKPADIYWLLQNMVDVDFNLGTGPLFQFDLIKAAADKFYFTILVHPIIIDRYSVKHLVAEISRHYNAIQQNIPTEHEAELFDFNRIVELEKKFYASEKCNQGLTHWTNTLKANQFHLDLPKQGFFSKEYKDSPFFEIFLASDLYQQVKNFAEQQRVDWPVVLIAVYQVLLQRYTSNKNIIINYSNAVSYSDKKVFGCLENRLPLRVMLSDEMSFLDLVDLNSKQLAYDRYYQDVQINDIVKSVRDKYDRHFTGIFSNTSFDCNYLPYEELQLGNVSATLIPKYMKKFVTESVAFYYRDTGKTISLIADFDEQLDNTAIKNFMRHYETLLANCLANPSKPITQQTLLSPEEYQQIIVDWNQTQLDYSSDLAHQLFEAQVKKTPDKIALVAGDQYLTYQEVNQKANQLAHVLRKRLDLLPDAQQEQLVGICLGRSIEMIVSMLAILKAGAAYVPMDPKNPHERLLYILENTQMKVVITNQELSEQLPFLAENQRKVVCLDQCFEEIRNQSSANLNLQIPSERMAYVIYTSGSTGLPKGVMIQHSNLIGLIAGYNQHIEIEADSRILQFSSMNFDVAVPEIFHSLAYGACVHVASEQLKQSPEAIVDYMINHKITIVFFTPAFMKLLPHRDIPDLKSMIFGGDVCDQETMEFWSKSKKFFNGYGPTETTVFSTFSKLNPGDLVNRIGKPLANYQAYVLDAHRQPLPVGVIGELYVGGVGVSRGYVNKPETTAERFLPNPFVNDPTLRMYKTGDLVRWLPDGNIEYVGRSDFEVKIRGFRIHMGDIEHVLEVFPGMKQLTTKIWQKPGLEKFIAVYYVLKEGVTADSRDLKIHLQKNLPEYMVPSYLIQVDELPISVNGKINKDLLPDPLSLARASGQVENKEEESLKEIWSDLFKVSPDVVSPSSDFFDLGGHSLLATQLVSRIKTKLNIDVTVKQIFQNSQLKQLAKLIRETTELVEQQFVLQRISDAELYPLSYSQTRLWYLYKSRPQCTAYNIVLSIKFDANINIILLRKAFTNLVNEQEIFRTAFIEKNGEAFQKIVPKIECDIPIVDCSTAADFENALQVERKFAFQLDTLPLFRGKLLCSSNNDITLLFNVHHIIFDGWSLEVFMRDLGRHYTALAMGQTSAPKQFEITCKDFAHSQIEWNEQGQFNQQLAYWQRKLSKPLPILDLPTDFKRPKEMSFEGDTVRVSLPESIVREAKKIALNNKTSLFSLFLSVYYILLHRITGQSDLIVAAPIANRNKEELEGLIGFFVNVATYRMQITDHMTFDELLRQVNDEVIASQENQDLPFDLIVNQIVTERDTSRNPIFQTMLVLQNGYNLAGNWAESGINYQIVEEHTNTSKFDLVLVLNDSATIEGFFEFNSTLFKKSTIERMSQHFANILRAIIDNPQRIIENIPLLSANEYKMIIHQWNQTERSFHKDTIHRLFENIAEQYPENGAVVYQDQRISYQELNQKANQLAHYICDQSQKMSLVPGKFIIGLNVSRGINMIVAILAVLKAGAAYVPLDPEYPRERLNYILDDTKLKLIITEKNLSAKLDFLSDKDFQFIYLDENQTTIAQKATENLSINVKPSDLAYVIYTSGSTGLPKGVMIEHKGVPNLAEACQSIFKIQPTSRVLEFASINFDAAILEIFTPLLTGACIYIIEQELRYAPEKLVEYLAKNEINMALIPPALLRILPKCKLPALHTLTFGGDICDQETVDFWSKDRHFFNLYGPTEVTVCSTFSELISGDPAQRIGKPLPNYTAYVLDKNLNPVPIGVPGELYVGSVGLARGYLNRPDLTVERFIVNPFSENPQDFIYKTGDLVRWLSDGNLEYIGRSDFQVQIRGFRVELGEIEEVLSQHSAIKEVTVAACGQGETRLLVAYYTLQEGANVIANQLQRHVQLKLPDYMVPSAMIQIEKMPFSPNGKIDKKALPAFDENVFHSQDKFVAPRDETEKKLADIWCQLFNFEKIGIRDSFFSFGGNSLFSIRMLARVNEAFNCEISLAKFFQHPTIEGLADIIAGREQEVDVLSAIIQDAKYQLPTVLTYSDNATLKNILLTGANGFLGVHLLSSLIHHTDAAVYCMVRGKSEADINTKMHSTLRKFGLTTLLDHPRVKLVRGDLEKNKLDLAEDQWQFLAENIDAIYHNGALVNHLYDYQLLKAANVGSTIELLNLCITHKAKQFHFISTLSAASIYDENGMALETSPGDQLPEGPGYITTKWVSEKIVQNAAAKGVKAVIYRPGNITGHSKTGVTNYENNHSLLLMKSCVQLGVAPIWNTSMEMMPVDLLSDAIVQLSKLPIDQLRVHHMGNPHQMSYFDYFKLIDKLGYSLEMISSKKWREEYLQHIGEENALYSLRDFYVHESDESNYGPKFLFEANATQQCLQDLGIEYLKNYDAQIRIYLDYLEREGFLVREMSLV